MKKLLSFLFVAILACGTSTATADVPFIQFDYTALALTYDGSIGRNLVISETASSTGTVALKDGLIVLDGPAVITGGASFDLDFSGTVGSAAEGYAITGTFSATDIATGSPAFDAAFESTSVQVLSAWEGTLLIEGSLAGIGDSEILVNRALGDDDWVYAGDGAATVTVHNTAGHNTGQLFQMTFGVDGSSLADLFDHGSQAGGGGFMHGTIAPVAPAVVLGGIGLVAVCVLRRWRGTSL